MTAVQEIIRNLGGIRCNTGNIEPETDPGDLHLQVFGIFLGVFLPAVFGAQIGGIGKAAGLIIDQWTNITNFACLELSKQLHSRQSFRRIPSETSSWHNSSYL